MAISAIFDSLKKSLTPFIVGGIFSVLTTSAVFYLTSDPVTSPEIRLHLMQSLSDKIKNDINIDYKPRISINYIKQEPIDLSASHAIIFFGTTKLVDSELRILAIFERGAPSLLDKLVGRSGSYLLKSITRFDAPDHESLTLDSILVDDIDNDGNKEILVRLKSIFADSTDISLIILKKNNNENWNFLCAPSISQSIKDVKNGIYQPPGYVGGSGPFRFFGMNKNSKKKISPPNFSEIADDGVYESTWTAVHNEKSIEFYSLRNGGNYFIKSHSVKGYPQIVGVAFSIDGNAVLAPHYAVVTTFKIEQGNIVRDTLWNWGYPMVSNVALNITDLNINSLHEAGILSHVVGDVFYGYVDFQKLDKPFNNP